MDAERWRGYRAFGLGIRSQIVLPELVPDAMAPADVLIRLGTVQTCQRFEPSVFLARDEMRLDAIQVRYSVLQGREILVEPVGDASDEEIRRHLLGPIMGVVCHQRGLTPLHAGAFEIDGLAIILAGPSGAGKSTLIAYLQKIGFRAICDDICPIDFDTKGAAQTWNGSRRLKLWSDAMTSLGLGTTGADRVAGAPDKFSVPMIGMARDRPIPVARVYILHPPGPEQAIRRLGGAEAVDALVSHVYRWGWAVGMGRARAGFEACVALAQRGDVFAFDRRWGFDGLRAQAEALGTDMAKISGR